MYFFLGLFFGCCAGMVMSAFIVGIGEPDHSADDYHRGYVDGWHDAGGKE